MKKKQKTKRVYLFSQLSYIQVNVVFFLHFFLLPNTSSVHDFGFCMCGLVFVCTSKIWGDEAHRTRHMYMSSLKRQVMMSAVVYIAGLLEYRRALLMGCE